MPTTTIILVRHAAHDRLDRILCGRMPGVSLGETGRAEAGRVADRLAGEDIAAIHTSPLRRARETAAPLAERTGVAPEVREALNEVDSGAWAGRSFESLRDDPLWTSWNTARSVSRPPGGETMLEVQLRVLRYLDEALAAHPERTVVAVSHGDVIRVALLYCLGMPIDAWPRLEVSPASVSRLVIGDWGTKVMSMNEVPA